MIYFPESSVLFLGLNRTKSSAGFPLVIWTVINENFSLLLISYLSRFTEKNNLIRMKYTASNPLSVILSVYLARLSIQSYWDLSYSERALE